MKRITEFGLLCMLCSLAFVVQAADFTFYGPGKIDDARAIAIAPNGDLWVGNSGQIIIFSPDGRYKETMEQVGGQVNSLLFTPNGELIIGFNDSYIAYYHGKEKYTIGEFGSYSPWEVALDSKGCLYATDGGNHIAKKYAIEGTRPQTQTTYKAPDNDAMLRPYSLALDARDRVYITDENKPGIWVFQNDGTFLKHLLPTVQCWRIRSGRDGLYVVTDAGISVLDAGTGGVLRRINVPAGQNNVRGFALAADGTMYFGDFYQGVVRKISADGQVLSTYGPSFRATLSIPDRWTPGETLALPWKVEAIATHPVGQLPPVLSFSLLPAMQAGEPDANFRD